MKITKNGGLAKPILFSLLKYSPKIENETARVLSETDRHENVVILWNTIAIDCSGLDHTLPQKDQLGPCRSSRAMAIAHIAANDAVCLINQDHVPYLRYKVSDYAALTSKQDKNAMIHAAIGSAFYHTLLSLFPQQEQHLKGLFALFIEDLALLSDRKGVENGYTLGQMTSFRILEVRKNDGSAEKDPKWATAENPNGYKLQGFYGEWTMDPISQIPLALGANWPKVTPFVMASGDQFRSPPFPKFDTEEYAREFNEVYEKGGDGIVTPTTRTEDETDMGIFWAYDGVPTLCAPPRLYNYVILHIAKQKKTPMLDILRLLAIENVAMADAAIAAWDTKYFYRIWRPITGINQASGDPFTNQNTPYGSNKLITIAEQEKGNFLPTFSPLGAPSTNGNGPNFTPPFPAYVSGHAVFGSTMFQILRDFYGTDDIPFTFVSDELNGQTLDNHGNVRPLKPRSFANLRAAEHENAKSRIYLGIHWDIDSTEGIKMGHKVGALALETLYKKK